MPEAPRSKRRGLVGFYIGIGVVILLFGGGWFASGPLRAWYWEREVRRSMQGLTGGENPRVRPVRKLVAVGPPARAAVERLFNENDDNLHLYLILELGDPKNTWALPALVEQVRADKEFRDWTLLETIEIISGRNFREGLGRKSAMFPAGGPWFEEDWARARDRILDWWEKEGWEKYGSGK